MKKDHFRYILGPPGPTQEMQLMRSGGEGPSRSPPVSPAMNEGARRYITYPRTAGGLSHLRTAGGGGADDRPPDNSKTKRDSDKR